MDQFRRMRIVAIAAADAVVKHLALQKRTVHIIFISNLTVRMVGRNIQQLQRIVVIKIAAGHKTLLYNSAARMTRSARLHLSQIRWSLEFRQPFAVFAIPENAVAVGKFDMQAGRAVARFAADVNLRERRLVLVGQQLVILLQVGAVAFGT